MYNYIVIMIPMKTGFSLIEPPKPDTELLNKLNNLLIIFAEKSIHLGAHYAKTSGRYNLSGMDTIYALQYLAHEFMDMENLEQLIKEKESNDSEESESENESESESNCEEIDDDTFTIASDEDSICKKMNYYHNTWSEWNPTDDIEILLKRNIDKTLESI